MTNEELEELFVNAPRLYHMAESDSWASIKERGLLSTSAILDLYGVTGDERKKIEETRRPASVTLELSPLSHPAMRRVLASFELCLLGGATGRGAEPSR